MHFIIKFFMLPSSWVVNGELWHLASLEFLKLLVIGDLLMLEVSSFASLSISWLVAKLKMDNCLTFSITWRNVSWSLDSM